MTDTRNIVILGASNAGLLTAHYVIRHLLPKLRQAEGPSYRICLVDPSTHYWWHVAAPRAIVSTDQIKHRDYFKPVADSFEQYDLASRPIIRQGAATRLSTADRQVLITVADGTVESLPYYALVIATGISSPTPLTTLHGDHQKSIVALEETNRKLAVAKEVIIGGGGPVGVETAGEIATGTKANVTLVTSSSKLIPIFSEARSNKVHKLLQKHGVSVKYSTKVIKTVENGGQVDVHLSDGSSHTVDVYIPASGVLPNTDFLPKNLVVEKGYVRTNSRTLRVDEAGPRVYALGDVAGVNQGGMMLLDQTTPVMCANLAHDVLKDAGLDPVAERYYTAKNSETQVVPIGRNDCVGAFNGWTLPSFVGARLKGKDYMKSFMTPITTGSKVAKP